MKTIKIITTVIEILYELAKIVLKKIEENKGEVNEQNN